MKKNNYLIIGGIVLLILILGGGFFLFNQSNSTQSNQINELSDKSGEDNSTVAEDNDNLSDEGMPNSLAGRYVEFESGITEDFADSNRVLYFYANWCPICRPVDKELRENQDRIPEDMTIIRVNYNDPETDDDEKALAKTYGVTYQHTFVQIDKDGNEITKWNGGGLEEILQNTK